MGNRGAADKWVEAQLPWNFTAGVIDAVAMSFGLSFVSRETVMPLLVSQLTSSRMAIGLIGAIYSLGFYVPQLLAANLTEKLPYRKPFVVLLGGLGERLPYLLIALVLWSFAGRQPQVALVLFFLLLTVSAVSNGVATPAWFDMIAKVIPVRTRGVFSGVGCGLGALLSIGGAMLAGRALASRSFPDGFVLCFALSFVAMALSWGGLAMTREPASLETKPHIKLGHYLRQLPTILRHNGNYARFLVGRSIAILGTMAVGFYMAYGHSQFALGGEHVGNLTAVLVGSQAATNLLWGVVGDRYGHKAVLTGSAVSMALAAIAALLSTSPYGLAVVFALVGISMGGKMVSDMNIILEFCEPADRPTYIGLTNTLLAPVKTLAPLLGGVLATGLGYSWLFVAALLASALSALWMAWRVREPSRIVRKASIPVP